MSGSSRKIAEALQIIDRLTPEDRQAFFDELDVVLKTPTDRALSLVERMTDAERVEFFDLYESMFCVSCGATEGEEGHECSIAEGDDDGDDEEEFEDDGVEEESGDEEEEADSV